MMIDHNTFSVSYIKAYLDTLAINEELSDKTPEIINMYITHTFVFNFTLFMIFLIILLMNIYTGVYEAKKIYKPEYSHKFGKDTHISQVWYYKEHQLPYTMLFSIFTGLFPLAGMYFTKVWIDILISKRYFLENSIENHVTPRSGSLKLWDDSFLSSMNSITMNADRFYSIFYSIILITLLIILISATIKILIILKNNDIKEYNHHDNGFSDKNVYEIYISTYLIMYMVLSFIIIIFSAFLFYKPFLVSLYSKELFIFLNMG